VLGDADDAGHWRLSEVEAGDRIAFRGRVFDTADVDADGLLEVRATELVVSRVVQTFERQSDTVIDAEILYEDGTVEVITGTPEHPFWVPALQQWVPLGELVDGTELHVDSGAGAILVGKTWRQGDFTVYNFEVEKQHNYFVRAPGSESGAVLVHNTCFGAIGSPAGLAGRSFEGWMQKALGGSGPFKMGGREFDGAMGRVWYEAKGAPYWNDMAEGSSKLEKFKSDMGSRLRIAKDNDASYQLFTNGEIPDHVKSWLDNKGIPYQQVVEQP